MDNDQGPDQEEPRKIRVVDKRTSSRSTSSTDSREGETPAPSGHAPPPPPPETPPKTAPEDRDEASKDATVTTLHPPTPEGVASAHPAAGGAAAQASPSAPPGPPGGPGGQGVWTPEQEDEARRMAEEMARIPSLEWVINVSVTLANAAGTKLNAGLVEDAALAIDALSGILEKVAGHLGDAEAPLRETLAQLQMAYAQIAANPEDPLS